MSTDGTAGTSTVAASAAHRMVEDEPPQLTLIAGREPGARGNVVVRGGCVLHGGRVNDMEHLLVRAARAAAEHRRTVGEGPVAPELSPEDIRAAFAGPLPDEPADPHDVLSRLLAAADGAIMGTAGPRYFGFVIGGALPAASAADVLTTGWDQAAYNEVLSPAAGAAERAAGGWAKELLGLPTQSSVAFVTGAQAGNTVGLASLEAPEPE